MKANQALCQVYCVCVRESIYTIMCLCVCLCMYVHALYHLYLQLSQTCDTFRKRCVCVYVRNFKLLR